MPTKSLFILRERQYKLLNLIKIMKPTNSIEPGGVEQYIAKHTKDVQEKLNEIRSAIQEAAPKSTETISYFQMPGYFYKGYDYNGMFAWFSYKKPSVRLHIRPPVIEEHIEELTGYSTTKSIISFPANKEIPISLVKKLVKASIKVMKEKKE
jgi:uncharacterized protein YdhG (YjbR/CyaY superfamily)